MEIIWLVYKFVKFPIFACDFYVNISCYVFSYQPFLQLYNSIKEKEFISNIPYSYPFCLIIPKSFIIFSTDSIPFNVKRSQQ